MGAGSENGAGAGEAVRSDLLESVIAACGEGVWVVDTKGATVLANDRMLALLGVARHQFRPGTRLEQLLPAVAREQIRGKLALRAAGVHDSYEVRMLLPDGRRRRLAVTGSPRYDRTGRYVGAIAMCTDVTDGQDLEELSSSEADSTLEQHKAGPMITFSARESQVVHRLLIGDRVPAIARSLSVSQSTIRNQLSSVFHKTGVGFQQDLISLLRRRPHTTTD